ncbi:hypothetical protein [uncultured Pseudacidovorax sp.]|uniref:hypothetical protein n=1 Tax=uncultured Pseudacidovorax sp. TaxID=679313 RepID=UPI0025F60D7C|nr:hypothetical protein [uncultured Pseudacidovorax sp.]
MTDLSDSSWLRHILLDGDLRAGREDEAADGAAAMPHAEWAVLTSSGVQTKPILAAHLLAHAAARPDVGIFYVDELVRDSRGDWPLLKPDFDLTWLVSANYVGLPLCVRGDILARFGGVHGGGGAFQAYVLLLRAAAAGIAITRIPELLAERTTPPRHDRLLHAQAVAQWLGPDRPLYEIVDGHLPSTLELLRRLTPEAAPPLTICLVQDDSHGTAADTVLTVVQRLQRYDYPAPIQLIVEHDGSANFSSSAAGIDVTALARANCRTRARNAMWRASRHELMVFLDARIDLPEQASWLNPLLAHALQEDVGGCSPVLMDREGAIVFAGMAGDSLGLLRLAGREPAQQDASETPPGGTSREWSMLSWQAFATRRSLLEETNGFDERFGPALAVADLCLKLRMLGMRSVCAAPVPLTVDSHLEVAGLPNDSAGGWARFMERWHPFLEQDPCWHPDMPPSGACAWGS